MADFRAFSFSRGCWTGNFVTQSGLSDSVGLVNSVGRGGRNAVEDVMYIQRLLNAIPLNQGAPQPLLDIDGIAGPLTTGAISRFQQKHLGWSDSRIDPRGPTITRLESLSWQNPIADAQRIMRVPTPPASQVVPMVRRNMAINVLGDAERALHKTLLELDMVSLERLKDAVRLHDFFPGRRSLRILNRHFAMASLPAEVARSSFQFIRQTVANMRAILTRTPSSPGNPWGNNIIEIDQRLFPIPGMEGAEAYTPKKNGNPQHLKELGISPWHIYFTRLIDGRPPDYFLMTVLHELAHFVSDANATPIEDRAYAWDTYQYQHLPHKLRLLNADCYALLAFEYFAGQDRIYSIYPNFPREIYEEDVT